MCAKQFSQLGLNILRVGMLFLTIAFLPLMLRAADMSVAEYNQMVASQKRTQYLLFQAKWFGYLTKKINFSDLGEVTPYLARTATEDYLLQSGGLKKIFAGMSRSNRFGFTFNRPVDDKRIASYHRSFRSIFMDIEMMSPNEWLMIFVHEVAHSLDSEIFSALSIYNDPEFISKLKDWKQKNLNLVDLSKNDRQQLNLWLLSGLNRGFLAEYRAWLVTYRIYQEGLNDGVFQEIDWLEQIKNSRPKEKKMSHHIFSILSKTWTDPVEGLFATELVRNALTELRAHLEENPNRVQLGNLKPLIDLEIDKN